VKAKSYFYDDVSSASAVYTFLLVIIIQKTCKAFYLGPHALQLFYIVGFLVQ